MSVFRLVTKRNIINTNIFTRSIFVPMPVFIPPGNNNNNPKPPIKDEENYNQSFDVTPNPLYQCNPVGVNECVNNSKSMVSYNVKMLINGLASTDRQIYKLVDNSNTLETNKIIDEYNINTLTPTELASVNSYMTQIVKETEKEYNQVTKLITNRDTLIKSVSNSIEANTFTTILGSLAIAYMEYRYFTVPCSKYGFPSYLMYDVLKLQYWGWIIPTATAVVTNDRINTRNKLKDLYAEYTQKNYMGKYQYKLDMLNKVKQVLRIGVN